MLKNIVISTNIRLNRMERFEQAKAGPEGVGLDARSKSPECYDAVKGVVEMTETYAVISTKAGIEWLYNYRFLLPRG